MLKPYSSSKIRNMPTSVDTKKLKSLIKESVKEVLEVELMKLRALALPEASPKEQKDIEKRYGKASRRRSKSYTFKV